VRMQRSNDFNWPLVAVSVSPPPHVVPFRDDDGQWRTKSDYSQPITIIICHNLLTGKPE
jgi:hypothetical protein